MASVIKTYIRAIVFFCTSLFIQLGFAQNPLEKEVAVFANAVDAEKIYLQLSGATFNTSETIWFKAIITNMLDHTPTTKSGVLHVELIDPLDNRIVDKSLLKISNGIANGFFQLHSSYGEGTHIVRAYTEWNKNFGSDFISSVPIKLYRAQKVDSRPNPIRDIAFRENLNSNTLSLSSTVVVEELDSLHTGEAILYMHWKGGKDSISIKQTRKKPKSFIQHDVPIDVPIVHYRLQTKNKVFSKSIVLDNEYGSLQFFPEGGALVAGLQSVVGFKYLDYRGKGAEIKGTILDDNDREITEFKSNALGMGKVTLTPKAEHTYYSVLTTKSGDTFKYELPKAKKKGLVLSLINKNSKRELRIWNKEKNIDSIFIKFFHRGKNLFFIKTKFINGMFSYKIQPKDLPHGVVGLTVFDKNFKPIAERHFFNKIKDENLDIFLETDNSRYTVRDSVQVSITTQQNGQSVPASVSVMAIDSSYFYGTGLERNTIVSFFLLQSDVKGTVENPAYYFENGKGLDELDFLMLTQGWTNYKYKEKKKPRLIAVEKNLEIKGIVEDIQNAGKRNGEKKRIYELNLLTMGGTNEAYIKDTDSSGYFKFVLADSYGLGRKFVIQPSEASNKNSNLKISIQQHEAPEIAYEPEKVIIPVDSIIEKTIMQKIKEDIRIDPFLLPNTIALNEVEVSDYKITPERAEMVALHGIPDVVIDSEELINKRKNWTNNLYKWLLFNHPDDIRIGRVDNGTGFEMAHVPGAEWTYIVVDGIPVHELDYRFVGGIPISAVKSTEIIRNTETANEYFYDVFDCAPICSPPQFPAILAIYTYSGNGLLNALGRFKKTNIINDTAPQYTPIREYYVPEYHQPSKIDWDVPDRRALLYWKPNITTDSKGQAKTTFFNSDLTGKMVLLCEGITANGKVGYSELFYKVENR